MTTKTMLALVAALMLAACGDGYSPSAANQAGLDDDMLRSDPMLSPGSIDDATGTQIP